MRIAKLDLWPGGCKISVDLFGFFRFHYQFSEFPGEVNANRAVGDPTKIAAYKARTVKIGSLIDVFT
jgi:hypothetical protein